jgi:PAS domain S-box-containing protein
MRRGTRAEDVRSGDALFVFDEELRIRSWNRAAEELTGLTSEEAIGHRCWEVLGGTEEGGALVCHARCSYARLAREGWPVRCHDLVIKTDAGRRRVALSTIALGDSDPALFVHLMLSDGHSAKTIAGELGLKVATVRNHIRAILNELCVHSQLEALAKARRHGLLPR